MEICSNFSLEERLKCGVLDRETSDLIELTMDKLFLYEKEIETLDRRCELYYEQMQFCKDFIAEAMDLLRKAELKADFVEARQDIEMLLENSYVEL
ncbi:hypothetical protein UFOVP1516_23 [uncultured Caudovirales phage]|uniref:Uncharacterized protein n=1 Tax=uncultured Caudovirales phage TaxID=2100421 RepID=A0A6J7XAD7_9CAUD|nr:hypothetical protein UFOVP887_21 [uncultured Caudovirales phage]CAB5226776.1 hypothetical protein UFOVP1516_23 [uncultured Caudovirales phage]